MGVFNENTVMKKGIILTVGMLLSLNAWSQTDPVLIQVDNKSITKSEFLQVYLKNNPNPKYDKETLDEYMDLYRKFQLKVAEAERLGYDTIPQLKRELAGYQKQLAQPYLTDRQMNEYLVKEAYNRLQKEVRASHILINVDPHSSPADTLKAYQKAMDLRARLLKGEDFINVAKASNDPSVNINHGDLGFFTAFQMVYPFEDAAFNMAIGDISMPIRTRFGYHILKKTDERASRGTMKAAHLLVSAHIDNSSDAEILSAKNKAQELYTKIKNGESFETLVRQYSDDNSSASNGGVLPVFGSGAPTRLVPQFEDAAFALQNDGDISEPIQTNFGFHIIKRMEAIKLPSYEDSKKDLENRVNRDERAMKTQKSYVEKLKKEYHYQDLSKKTMKWFTKNIDSTIYKGNVDTKSLDKKNRPVFSLNNKIYTQKDLATYMASNGRVMKNVSLTDLPNAAKDKYVSEEVIALEKQQLTVKYPEYKALLTEYHDGILLYEIMSNEVWNKALLDSAGLENFYNTHKDNYRWDKRFDAVVYEFQNENLAKQALPLLKKGQNSEDISKVINKNSELNLRVKEGKFEISKTPYLKAQNLVKGINPIYTFEGKSYIIDVREIIEPKHKELSEAKGIITSDYQNQLEKDWLEALEKSHTIKINNDVLYSIGK